MRVVEEYSSDHFIHRLTAELHRVGHLMRHPIEYAVGDCRSYREALTIAAWVCHRAAEHPEALDPPRKSDRVGVGALLRAIDGVGPKTEAALRAEAGIAAGRRLYELSPDQARALAAALRTRASAERYQHPRDVAAQITVIDHLGAFAGGPPPDTTERWMTVWTEDDRGPVASHGEEFTTRDAALFALQGHPAPQENIGCVLWNRPLGTFDLDRVVADQPLAALVALHPEAQLLGDSPLELALRAAPEERESRTLGAGERSELVPTLENAMRLQLELDNAISVAELGRRGAHEAVLYYLDELRRVWTDARVKSTVENLDARPPWADDRITTRRTGRALQLEFGDRGSPGPLVGPFPTYAYVGAAAIVVGPDGDTLAVRTSTGEWELSELAGDHAGEVWADVLVRPAYYWDLDS